MDRWFSHVFSHHWGICFCFDLPKRRFMARPGRPSPLTRSPSEEVLGLPGRSAAEENVWKISALGRNFFGPQATSRSSRHTDSEHSCIAIWCVLICSYMFLCQLASSQPDITRLSSHGHSGQDVPSDLAFCCFHLGCFRKSAMDIPKRLWKSDSERYCSLRAGSTSAGLPGQR